MIFRLPADPAEVGPALKQLRIRLGVKQQAIVDAGVGSQSTISCLENGHKSPLMVTVLGYLAVLECALDVSPLNGEEIPEARGTKAGTPRGKVYVPRPAKRLKRVYRKPKVALPDGPNSGRPSPGTTATGRCLGCFTVHPAGQELCP